jgi:general secretion pathway protein I
VTARRGFSLLEVMVAVTILGLVLTVILSAQGGLSSSNRAAARSALAIQLARCKMVEAEEKILKNGMPEIDQIDTELPCCEDFNGADGYRCDVKVEKVELPPPPSSGGAGDAGLDFGGITNATAGTTGSTGGLGALAGGAGGAGLNLDGGLTQMGQMMNQQAGGGGADGLVKMAMGMVYPQLKVMMEASIRRITITTHWRDGSVPREFVLQQYVTNPQRGGFVAGVPGMVGPDGGPL